MPCRQPKPINGASVAVLKRRAHGRVHSQLKAGLLVKPDVCSHCGCVPRRARDGRSLLQAHHHLGYEHPLAVEWLCVDCHRRETPCNPLRGESAVTAKLTADDVRAIRSTAEGVKPSARRYGVTPAAIRQIRSGKTWAHLPAPALATPTKPEGEA